MKIINKYKNNILVILLYLGSSLAYTYPFILKFTKQVVGRGGDVFQNIAAINNNYSTLRELGYWESVLHTISHFRLDPISINTYFHFFFKQPTGYNLYWLFSFVAAGFGVYLLIKFIYKNLNIEGWAASTSAFIAGFIYSFSPAHIAWGMGFRGATHIEWIPFTTLYIFKFIKKPSAKNLVAMGLFFLLLVAGENHFAAFYFVFLIPFLIFYLIKNKQIFENKKFKLYSLIGLVLAVILVIFLYAPQIKISVSEENYLNPGLDQTIRYSPDFLSIITPTEFHPFWGDFFTPIRELFTGNAPTYSNYLGIVALLLSILSIFFAQRRKIKEVYFWSISALGFFILSLGPYLHFLGTVEPKVALPYLFLYKYAPFFENIRAVGRMWVIALLCFSVAAAFGLKYLFDHLPAKKTGIKAILAIGVFALLSLEFLSIPIPFSSLEYSPFYDQLKNDPAKYYIADIPGSTNYVADAKTNYYASIHDKDLISGLDPARKMPGKWELQRTTPVLSEILYALPNGKALPSDIINHDYAYLANKVFNYLNIPYIVIQKEFVGYDQDYILPEDYDYLNEFINKNFDIEKRYEDEYLMAYKIKKEPSDSFLFLGLSDGWNELNKERKTREFRNEATLKVFNQYTAHKNLSLSLNLRSPSNQYCDVSFYYNDELIGSFFSYDQTNTVNLIIPDILTGTSEIKMKVTDSKSSAGGNVILSDINYKAIENIRTSSDFESLYSGSDETIAVAPLYSSYYFQEASIGKDGEIYGHPVLSYSDLIVEDQGGHKALLYKLPLFNELYNNTSENKYSELEAYRDIRETGYYSDNIANIISDNNIGYVYIDKNAINKKDRDKLTEYLENHLPDLKVAEGEEFTIFTIVRSEKNASVPFVFGGGWDILENKLGISKRRKINSKASLQLYMQNDSKIEVKFKVRTCSNTTTYGSLEINGSLNDTFIVRDSEFEEISLNTINPINPGLNELSIEINNGQNSSELCPIWVSDISIYEIK